jgi:hypothetical protein
MLLHCGISFCLTSSYLQNMQTRKLFLNVQLYWLCVELHLSFGHISWRHEASQQERNDCPLSWTRRFGRSASRQMLSISRDRHQRQSTRCEVRETYVRQNGKGSRQVSIVGTMHVKNCEFELRHEAVLYLEKENRLDIMDERLEFYNFASGSCLSRTTPCKHDC